MWPRATSSSCPLARQTPTTTSIPTSTDMACNCTSSTLLDAGAWMIVPVEGSAVARVRALEGWGTLSVRDATWKKTAHGFSVRVRVLLPPLPDEYPGGTYPVSIDVLVNETVPPGRRRRRGQLVLSGAQGEFVYLRGDRHHGSRLVSLMIRD